MVARASEFERLAESVQQDRRAASLARERITLFRRDIAKMIAIGTEEGVTGDWAQMQARFRALSYRLPRSITPALVEPLARKLEDLAGEVGNLLDSHVSAQKQNGNDSQFGAHYQNSNTDLPIESEPAPQESRGSDPNKTAPPPPRQVSFPLGLILKACPDIAMYTRTGIGSWQDLIATASLVRSALGVSPSAWEAAMSAMGEVDAAITIASILQRAEEIKSPGGYLRGLTTKAAAGQYSIGPIIMSLLRRQTTASNHVSSAS
jgi:replication initiation protein RepC